MGKKKPIHKVPKPQPTFQHPPTLDGPVTDHNSTIIKSLADDPPIIVQKLNSCNKYAEMFWRIVLIWPFKIVWEILRRTWKVGAFICQPIIAFTIWFLFSILLAIAIGLSLYGCRAVVGKTAVLDYGQTSPTCGLLWFYYTLPVFVTWIASFVISVGGMLLKLLWIAATWVFNTWLSNFAGAVETTTITAVKDFKFFGLIK